MIDLLTVSSATALALVMVMPTATATTIAISSAVTKGVLPLEGKLYHVAVAQIAAGARSVRIGYLINGYAMDQEFANQIEAATNAGVMFATKENSVTMDAPTNLGETLAIAGPYEEVEEDTTAGEVRQVAGTEPLPGEH